MVVEVEGRALYPLGDVLAATDFPLVSMLPAGAFEGIYYLSAEAAFDENALVVMFELAFEGELALTPPGSDAIALVLNSAGVGWTGLRATVTIGAAPSILLEEVTLGLRLRGDILRDVGTGGPASVVVTADLRVSADGFTLERFEGATLKPAYVADTRIVVEATDVRPVFGPINPPGWLSERPDFHGLAIDRLAVTLPDEYLHSDPGAELRIELREAAIDADGFTGRLAATADAQHPVTGTLFGFRYRFRTFALDIDRNTVLTARLGVDLRLTPLEKAGEEKWIAIDVGFAAGGQVSAALSAAQPPGTSDDPKDLVSVELADVARLGIRALRIETADGVVRFLFSGTALVLLGAPAITWPAVEFDGLGIGSDGSLVLPTGGIRLQGALVATLGPVTLRAGGFGLGMGADGALVFIPPNEIGMAIEASAVSGGGYLRYEREAERFIGAVELRVAGFAVTAVGLFSTRLPGGEPGLSLLFVISITFPTPIALGFNFYFLGAGGLLGVNRGADLDRLRAGLRTGAVDNILFPEDVVNRIDAVIRDLDEVFPPARGQFLVGPMALLAWSTPPLITAKIGLVVEIGSPFRIALIGVLRAALPTADEPVLDLKVAFLGAIDFQAGLLSFDASIFDSYIGRGGFKISFEGDIAVRISWGTQPELVSSVGGFHPRYSPPAFLRLPAMRRITMSLLKDNPRLSLTAYFAITSNTVQFGAKLDFFFKVSGFSVVGEFGFDVLFQFSPFAIDAEVRARLAVRAGGSDILSLALEFSLRGPTPWIARGKASFKILFFSVSVEFEKRFGEEALDTRPDVAVLPQVLDALGRDGAWSGQLSAGASALVSLLSPEPVDGTVVIDAAGTVTVSQRVLPLDTDVSLFGTSRPSDARRVSVTGLRLGDDATTTEPVTDFFAPAAFRELSERDKLAAPSYEPRTSGVRAAGFDGLRTDYVIGRPVAYEVLVSDVAAGGQEEHLGPVDEARELFEALVPGGAAGRSAQARQRRLAAEAGTVLPVLAARERFGVASPDDLRPLRADGTPAAPLNAGTGTARWADDVVLQQADAEARRDALAASGRRVRIVPEVQLTT
jgi:hypothetical protein